MTVYSVLPVHGILLASELRRLGADEHELRNAAKSGELARLHRGAYVPRSDFEQWTAWERYKMRCLAPALSSRTAPVLSHLSAAVVWGVPTFGVPPGQVHVLATLAAGTRTEHGFTRHAVRDSGLDVAVIDGIAVTSFVRTLVEFSATAPFDAAIAALDWALIPSTSRAIKRFTTRAELSACAERLGRFRGKPAFNRALAFASPLSESVGESVSRANMHLLGFPDPVLQQEFSDAAGFIGRCDFWWEEYNQIGEFDGKGKYLREEFLRGASPGEVVVAEKQREDRLRATATRPGVTRWGWDTAVDPSKLSAHLRAVGIRPATV